MLVLLILILGVFTLWLSDSCEDAEKLVIHNYGR